MTKFKLGPLATTSRSKSASNCPPPCIAILSLMLGARPDDGPNGSRSLEAHRADDPAIHGERSCLRQGASRS